MSLASEPGVSFVQVQACYGKPFIEPTICSRWILKSSATPEVFEEGLGGCFVAETFSGC